MPLVLLLLLAPVVVIGLMPLILVQRYRAGKARRLARSWVATFGLVSMVLSTVFFLITAAFTTIWVPKALTAAAAGIAIGLVLGGVGIMLTHWESAPASLHYTPNRWLVLIVTLIVSARVLYGLFHSIAAARAGMSGEAMVSAFGVPQSLAAGAMVIGYYLAYQAGLRWRIRQWQHRALRRM